MADPTQPSNTDTIRSESLASELRVSERPVLDWSAVLAAIDHGERFVLTTHVRPDTDGIGSAIALHRALTQRGKRARILTSETLAPNLRLFDPDGAVEKVQADDEEWVRSSTVIVLDVADRARLGPVGAMLEGFDGTLICIDHHLSAGTSFATIDMIDPTAPATGALVWDALRAMDAPIDAVCAQALYATLVADTGSFRFSNTNSRVLRVAADLIELGAAPAPIARAVLAAFSRAKMELLGHVFRTAGYACDRRLAWCSLSRATLDAVSGIDGDADGLIEYLRLEDAVRVALLFLEIEGRKVKVSFRSEEGFDINLLAARWGGGGHRYAAGAVIDGALDDVIRDVVASAKELLEQPPP